MSLNDSDGNDSDGSLLERAWGAAGVDPLGSDAVVSGFRSEVSGLDVSGLDMKR